MNQLHAQPYDISARGFYFETTETYETKAKTNRNDYGEPVEEYEIQFIDGSEIDCELAKAWGLNQASFAQFLEKAEEWEEWEKIAYIIAVGECGCDHDEIADDPASADITLYEMDSLHELAEQFVDDGLFGDIPERLQNYIDYEAIARDLEVDYSQVTIAGTRFIFHCP